MLTPVLLHPRIQLKKQDGDPHRRAQPKEQGNGWDKESSAAQAKHRSKKRSSAGVMLPLSCSEAGP